MTETYIWAGSHAYRDHANDRVIEPGEEIPEDSIDRITSAHPHDVEEADEEHSDDGEDEAIAEFDVDEFVEKNATDQVEAIEAGDVDPFLTAIRDANDEGNEYSTVEEAVSERLDELDEE